MRHMMSHYCIALATIDTIFDPNVLMIVPPPSGHCTLNTTNEGEQVLLSLEVVRSSLCYALTMYGKHDTLRGERGDACLTR